MVDIQDFSSLLTIGFMAIQTIVIVRKELRKMRSSGKIRPTTSDSIEINMTTQFKNVTQRDVLNLMFGITAILLAMGNLALLRFGPNNLVALSTGNAASIASSLILAFSGLNILWN